MCMPCAAEVQCWGPPQGCDLKFSVQAGYPVAGRGLDTRPPEQGISLNLRWADCNGQNGHGNAPDQAFPGHAAPAHAVHVVLLAAEDSYAPILAAAVYGERRAKTGADAAAANGGAHLSEEVVSSSRYGFFLIRLPLCKSPRPCSMSVPWLQESRQVAVIALNIASGRCLKRLSIC